MANGVDFDQTADLDVTLFAQDCEALIMSINNKCFVDKSDKLYWYLFYLELYRVVAFWLYMEMMNIVDRKRIKTDLSSQMLLKQKTKKNNKTHTHTKKNTQKNTHKKKKKKKKKKKTHIVIAG